MLTIAMSLFACDGVPLDLDLPNPQSADGPNATGPLAAFSGEPTCVVDLDATLVAVGLESRDEEVLGALPRFTQSWDTDGVDVVAATSDRLWVGDFETLSFDASVDASITSVMWSGTEWVLVDWDQFAAASDRPSLLDGSLVALEALDVVPFNLLKAASGGTVFAYDDVERELLAFDPRDGFLGVEVELEDTDWGPGWVAVTGERVFTLSRFGDGTLRGPGLYIRSFDRSTGRRLRTVQVGDRDAPMPTRMRCFD